MNAPTTDPVARRIKELSSEVRKLRGWVASDPSKADPLVDALNDLTAQRLLDHAWLACFADAREALTRSSHLVAFHGSVGPFTPLDDAVRFFTATTHVAWAQTGAGQSAAAAQTVAALRAWQTRVQHLDLADALAPRTAAWLLLAASSASLDAGRVTEANAEADAALDRAQSTEGGSGVEPAVLVDALTQLADARWAAGRAADSLAAGAAAVDMAWRVVTPLVDPGARVTPVWAARALEPLAGALATQAQRLDATGDVAAARVLRDDFAAQITPRLGALGTAAREALELVGAEGSAEALPVETIESWAPLSGPESLTTPTPRPQSVPAPSVTPSQARVPAEPATPSSAGSDVPAARHDDRPGSAQPAASAADDAAPDSAATPRPDAAPSRAEAVSPPREDEPATTGSAVQRQAYEAARAAGDRAGALAAATAWVDSARVIAADDQDLHGPDLVTALRALGDARFRSGDWWGARQPNKEAKALARQLGL